MTSTAAPPAPPSGGRPPAHAVVRFAGSLHGAFDRLAQSPTWSMTPEEQRAVLVELARAEARLVELRLRVLVAGGPQPGRRRLRCHLEPPAWLAHATKTTTASCHRDLHLATKLDETVPHHEGGAGGRA